MTDQEINIAIAECCGELNPPVCKPSIEQLEAILENKNPMVVVTISPDGEVRAVRDYVNDLNAIHEAEKVLKSDQCEFYHLKLGNMTNKAWHATAHQRSEAFLRTLSKWKE